MRIHTVAGLTGDRTAWVMTCPFRAPHHTISDAGLIGGGHMPTLGEVSLAYNGILFLDKPPEFRCHVLEVLRQPIEEHPTLRTYRTVAAISGKKRSCLASTALGNQRAICTFEGTVLFPVMLSFEALVTEMSE
jgi:hypothetical protein